MRSGDVISGRFDVQEPAGAGGMAEVWRARDLVEGGVVALKVLQLTSDSDHVRFSREARTLLDLRHPAIVRYVAHGATPEGRPYLAMEWLEGEDLERRLSRQGLGLADSVDLAIRVAGALGAAHERGVVHRDVKPGNLFLVDGRVDRVVVLDFGIARKMGVDTRVTRTGASIGTVGYMAPEQARGERHVDARADVFALGSVLFECVAGRPAFAGSHAVATLMKVVLEDPGSLRDIDPTVPEALDALVARMLAKDATARPATLSEVAGELAAIDVHGHSGVGRLASARAPALTGTEQRLLAVVLGRPEVDPVPPSSDAPTVRSDRAMRSRDGARAIAREHGGRAELLADGTVVVVIADAGLATDLAARAARCALAMRGLLRSAHIALAIGPGDAGRLPEGEVLERAARAADAPGSSEGVQIDEVTAGLLDDRFQVWRGDLGPSLVGERERAFAVRRLLGKATPCIGRERELAALMATFDECVAERVARAVVVTGPSGIGKSRLAHELSARLSAKLPSVRILVGRGEELSKGSAFGLIRSSIRRAAGLAYDAPLAVRRERLGARIAASVPEAQRKRVATFLGELAGAPFDDHDDVLLRSARADPTVMGDQVRTAWQDFLRAETERAPVVVLLEDLHWGDLASTKLVGLALKNLADRPWMVVALARPEVHEWFPALWKERNAQEISLGPLTPRASETLVRAVLPGDASDSAVQRIVALADGNALYLEELVRAAADGRPDEIPKSVVAMAHASLETLEPDARRVLRAASVFGDAFRAPGVAALLGGDPVAMDVGDWLQWLEEREVVIRSEGPGHAAGGEYYFRHAVVREAAYSMLTGPDRELGHRLAAAWLVATGDLDPLVIATHLERGAAAGPAIEWHVRAARSALEAGDFPAALERCARAATCGAEGEVLGCVRAMRGFARFWSGDVAAAVDDAMNAVALLSAGSDPWCDAVATAAQAGGAAGRSSVVRHHAALLEAELARGEASESMLSAAARVTIPLLQGGQLERADALLATLDALEATAIVVEPRVRAHIAAARALRAASQGDPGTFAELSEVSVRELEGAGHLHLACNARVRWAFAQLDLGSFDEAVSMLQGCCDEAERLDLQLIGSLARLGLGWALRCVGRHEEAASLVSAAVESFVAQGIRVLEGDSRTCMARIRASQGNLAEAALEARRATELLVPFPPRRMYALAVRASIAARAGCLEEARALAEEAMNGVRPDKIMEGEAFVRLVHADVLAADGDRIGAHRAISAARQCLRERAAKIASPAWRDSFLTRVPENARTLELAREWLGEPGQR